MNIIIHHAIKSFKCEMCRYDFKLFDVFLLNPIECKCHYLIQAQHYNMFMLYFINNNFPTIFIFAEQEPTLII